VRLNARGGRRIPGDRRRDGLTASALDFEFASMIDQRFTDLLEGKDLGIDIRTMKNRNGVSGEHVERYDSRNHLGLSVRIVGIGKLRVALFCYFGPAKLPITDDMWACVVNLQKTFSSAVRIHSIGY
jgi:hypothetical protein